MYIGLHVKYPLFVSDFHKTSIFSRLRKILKRQISWKSVTWKPSSWMRTEKHNDAKSRFSQYLERAQQHGDRPHWSPVWVVRLHEPSLCDVTRHVTTAVFLFTSISYSNALIRCTALINVPWPARHVPCVTVIMYRCELSKADISAALDTAGTKRNIVVLIDDRTAIVCPVAWFSPLRQLLWLT
jgi:hypothetical protein